ncbi:helix-turn-helix domain-containing protein [uncultured Draconibacterium sp.]|uniref:helix-turn-helix domain-containing protein n=1 Tax=uncultured Draconibacterium sp. TaxID=1573823 RepID=UPI0032604581
MVLNIESATSTNQKSLINRVLNYIRQRRLYLMVIGDIKKQLWEEIGTNLQSEDQERISVIISSKMTQQQDLERVEVQQKDANNPKDKTARNKREKQKRNGKGDFTVIGAAEYLGMGVSTIRKYQTDKKIKGYKNGNKRFFTREELDKLSVKEKTDEEIKQDIEERVLKKNKENRNNKVADKK